MEMTSTWRLASSLVRERHLFWNSGYLQPGVKPSEVERKKVCHHCSKASLLRPETKMEILHSLEDYKNRVEGYIETLILIV